VAGGLCFDGGKLFETFRARWPQPDSVLANDQAFRSCTGRLASIAARLRPTGPWRRVLAGGKTQPPGHPGQFQMAEKRQNNIRKLCRRRPQNAPDPAPRKTRRQATVSPDRAATLAIRQILGERNHLFGEGRVLPGPTGARRLRQFRGDGPERLAPAGRRVGGTPGRDPIFCPLQPVETMRKGSQDWNLAKHGRRR